MIKQATTLFLSTSLSLLASSNALSADARTLGLGGSAIANGYGIYGAVDNPASLMTQQRADHGLHVHAGMYAELHDKKGLTDALLDNEDIAADIEDEIEALSGQSVSCTQSLNDLNAVCLSGTEYLGQLSDDVLNIIDKADGNSISGGGGFDFGIAITHTPIPFSVYITSRLFGAAIPTINDGDRAYIQQFAESLDDGDLTVGEILENDAFSIAADGSLEVVQPEDILQSEIDSFGFLRHQVGVSLAKTIEVAGTPVDFGITPKISAITVANVFSSIADEFNDDSDSLSDQFENDETVATSITFDLGMALPLDQSPLAFAAVLRNAVPENITTNSGYKVKTTPQLILGTAYDFGVVTLSADMALNKAKIDNIDTQNFALGIETGSTLLKVRAGINHDTERTADATALTLGIGIGPLQVGARLAGDVITSFSSQVSAQLSYSF